MSFEFLDRQSAERFAELLDETPTGGRHHSRGPDDEALADLVTVGRSLAAARPGVHVDPEFRVGLRAMLVATAERDGIGRTATRPETEPDAGHAAAREPRRGLFGRAAGRRIRARGAIVIGVAAGAMAVSGISAASENAAPGDALYGVKRSTERAQLAMAGSDVTRGQLSLDFARNRLAEATSLGAGIDVTAVFADMDAATSQGVKLLALAAVERKDAGPLRTVHSFVVKQRNVLTPATGKLSPANQRRADESLTLLDKVADRAEALRTALSCGTIRRDGADTLGPKLAGCPTGTGATREEQPAGQAERQGSKSQPQSPSTHPAGKAGKHRTEPERSAPSAEPAVSAPASAAVTEPDAPDAPDKVRTNMAPASEEPTAAVVAPPPVDPRAEEEAGLLGRTFN